MSLGPNGLPPLLKLPAKEAAGPTPWSNWVIPGRVLAGAYPASLDDLETEVILTTLLELGVNTFVCLQAEVNINTPEHAWRAGHGLRPYIKDAQKILSKAHETGNPRITQQKIDFLHLPIIDGNVTTDSAMNRLAEDVMERVLRGERMYIHCWGGHGRTGTLVAVMLGRLYGLPYTNALRYTQAFHDARIYPQGVRSPQTPVQRAQVRRLLASQTTVPSVGPAVAAGLPVNRVVTPLRTSATTPLTGHRIGVSSGGPVLQAGANTGNGRQSTALSADALQRQSAPASPLRSRPLPVGNAMQQPRYQSPMKVGGLQADHMKSGSSALTSAMDRLSGDLGKLPPASGPAAASGMNRSLPYMLAQRTPPRGTSAQNGIRRTPQEVNVR